MYMLPKNFNDELNKISFTRHLFRVGITFSLFIVLFKYIGLIKDIRETLNMLYWCLGWDILLSRFSSAKVYYLRSALAYCTIGLMLCGIQIYIGH